VVLSRSSVDVMLANGEQFIPAGFDLSATVYPANAYDKAVTWSSSNSGVAKTDQAGNVTITGKGEAKITATAGGKTASCTVKVNPIPVDYVIIQNPPVMRTVSGTAVTDEKVQLTYTVSPSNAYDQSVKWESSNTKIATVDDRGMVTPKGVGKATITATPTAGAPSVYTFSVEPEAVLKFGFSRAFINGRVYTPEYIAAIHVGENLMMPETLVAAMLGATVTDSGATGDGKTSRFIYDGVVLNFHVGQDYLWYYYPPGFATSYPTGIAKPSDKIPAPIKIAGQIYLPVRALFERLGFKLEVRMNSDGNSGESYVVITKIRDLTFDQISAKISTATGAAKWKTVAPSYIYLPQSEMTLAKGTLLQMFAIVQTENAANYGVVWSMATLVGSDVARLNSSTGLLEARNIGKVKVTATAGGKSASCVVTVVSPVTRVSVLPKNITYEPTAIGQTYSNPFSVTIEPADADKAVTWSSSNPAVVAVNQTTGALKINGYGTATITAAAVSDPTKKANCVVTVKPPIVVTGVNFTHDPVVVFTSNTVSSYYTIVPSNATNRNVSTHVSDTAKIVAEYYSDGIIKVSGKAQGTARLTVTTEDGGYTANCDIIVVKPLTEKNYWLREKTNAYSKLGIGSKSTYAKYMKVTIVGEVGDWYCVQKGGEYWFMRKTVGLSEEDITPPNYTIQINTFLSSAIAQCKSRRILNYAQYAEELPWWSPPTLIEMKSQQYNAFLWWYGQVHTNAVWDIKWKAQWSAAFPDAAFPENLKPFIYRSTEMNAADLGNYLYGYLGRSAGFGDVTLYWGGGVAEQGIVSAATRTPPLYGDKPEDHSMIKLGYQNFNADYPNYPDIGFDGVPTEASFLARGYDALIRAITTYI
jgi:uncharacterized protein YjdB